MKLALIVCFIFMTTGCSSFTSFDVINGTLAVDDKSVTDEILCLSAFTSEVKIPKSKIQQNILDELSKRKITPEQCSSFVVSNAGGVESFCSDFNKGYVNGEAAKMPSFGNYITLQDMFLVQKTLGIDCNTKQYIAEHDRNIQRSASSESKPSDYSRVMNMFRSKTNVVNCTSVGSSTLCNDSRGNTLNINRW